MKRTHVLACILLLAAVSFAQQTPGNPQGTQGNMNPNYQTYTHPGETTGHGWGNWGLLGLIGLAGLLGRKRTTTATTYTRDERTYGGEQQRRVG